MRDKVLNVLLDHGTLVEPEAAKFILSQREPMAYVMEFLGSRKALPLVLTLDDLRHIPDVQAECPPPAPEPPRSTQRQLSGPEAPETPMEARPGELHIISDVTGTSTCNGSIEDLTHFFRDRFKVLGRMIRSNVEMGSPIKISQIRLMDREAKIIGMVMDVNKTKNGHLGITLEDDTGELFVFINKDSDLIKETILKDEVLGIVGRLSAGSKKPAGHKNGNDMFIAQSIHRPKIPAMKAQRKAAEDVEVVFMSDIHAGSSHFLDESWARFTEWISSDGAGKVRYVVVAGDLVDGIGVYPNQDEELRILDIEKQYEALAKLMSPIPESMTVLMQPGNHDAVRFAEPQPALDEAYRKHFGPNYRFIGNPCYFSIAGVEILAYHGRSIDDLVSTIPGITYQDPVPPMMEMLKRRLLAVSYGVKTPLAAEARDYMIINPLPDIMVTGHVHRTAVHRIPGMTLINASAWQSQTPFQRMHNFHPDPAKIVVTNLRTGRCRIMDFSSN